MRNLDKAKPISIIIKDVSENVNGNNELYSNDSLWSKALDNIGSENINKNGIKIFYIPILRDGINDKVLGDTIQKSAIGFFDNLTLFSSSNVIPSFTNLKDPTDLINNSANFVMYSHKNNWNNKVKDIIKSKYKKSKYFKSIKEKDGFFTPSPGDIIIFNIAPYYPTFTITGIDDDEYQYGLKRSWWVLSINTYVKEIIDYSLINDDIKKYDNINWWINNASKILNESNNLIKANDNVMSDKRNKIDIIQKGNTPFESVFGNGEL